MDLSDASYFGGNVARQCAAGTYPDYRDLLAQSLQQAVDQGHMKPEEMKIKLDEADSMWAKAKKDPNVTALMAARAQEKSDKEQALLRACGFQISELRGTPVTVQVVEATPKKASK